MNNNNNVQNIEDLMMDARKKAIGETTEKLKTLVLRTNETEVINEILDLTYMYGKNLIGDNEYIINAERIIRGTLVIPSETINELISKIDVNLNSKLIQVAI